MFENIINSNFDVDFIGAGPVALWTAINVKLQNPQLNVRMFEKYDKYTRIHNLFIEAASLKNDCASPLMDQLVKNLKSYRVISTETLENELVKLAEKIGITIHRNVEIFNPKEELQFSQAKVIVGADGAHSIVRKYIVGEEDPEKCFNVQKELHYIADLTYSEIKTTTLGSYVSKKMVKQEEKRTWCLVGDAAFGVPFFKSLNNGFVSGRKLAKTILASFGKKEEKLSFTKDNSFEGYESYMQKFAKSQIRLADIKSFGINFWINIAKMFQSISGSIQYFKASEFSKI